MLSTRSGSNAVLSGMAVYSARLVFCAAVMVGTSALDSHAQLVPGSGEIAGQVVDPGRGAVAAAIVTLSSRPPATTLTGSTDDAGAFLFTGLRAGNYQLKVTKTGFDDEWRDVQLNESQRFRVLVSLRVAGVTDAVTVVGSRPEADLADVTGVARLADVQDTALFAGKKTERLLLDRFDANLAAGNTRQVFAKVPGTNVWENDGSGLQIGVSTRGLDPNRSWEINSRQNGYDITADIFGYPEAYFTPPLEAVAQIEVVRGASSLQYGPQFGGLINYVLKEAPASRRFTIATEQTGGTDGFFNSHTRAGGRVGKVTYNGYFHHRHGDGWRQNSGFSADAGYGSVKYAVNHRLNVGVELTRAESLLQMAGGLTDSLFRSDARASLRSRNWFALHWTVPALRVHYAIGPSARLGVVVYGLNGTRHSLFDSRPVVSPFGEVNADDPREPRTLFVDRFHNLGAELRAVKEYDWRGRTHALAVGVRYYRGRTSRQHGLGSPGADPTFELFGREFNRDLRFTNVNVAAFAENMMRLTPRLSVTPGLRLDRIGSTGEGRPIVGVEKRVRVIPLAGLGVSYRLADSAALYGNASQAFRPTLFNDLWRPDPTVIVDPEMKDMIGHVAELGVRGRHGDWLSFDIGGFSLTYRNRLGLRTRHQVGLPTVSLWTNVADSRNTGLESFVEADVARLLTGTASSGGLSIFHSLAVIDARYLNGGIRGNRVESAPRLVSRSGVTVRLGRSSTTIQHSHVGDQFSDADNTLATIDGVHGRIPPHDVWDFFGTYRLQPQVVLRLGLNNLTDARYFTRRALSYPGPGLIPADGRRFSVGIGVEY